MKPSGDNTPPDGNTISPIETSMELSFPWIHENLDKIIAFKVIKAGYCKCMLQFNIKFLI